MLRVKTLQNSVHNSRFGLNGIGLKSVVVDIEMKDI